VTQDDVEAKTVEGLMSMDSLCLHAHMSCLGLIDCRPIIVLRYFSLIFYQASYPSTTGKMN
jgi:hypothetical protein